MTFIRTTRARDPFQEILNSFFTDFSAKDSGFPRLNVWAEEARTSDSKSKLYIQAVLAGYDIDDVEILTDTVDSSITFRYLKSKDESDDCETKDWYIHEIKGSSFNKKLRVPSVVNLTDYTSDYKNGILTLCFTFKTNEEMGIQKIKIN